MIVFVSYTRKDSIVTIEMLKRLNDYFSPKYSLFIHAIEELKKETPQEEVIYNLMKSDVMILLYTEGCLESPWVNLEIELSNLFEIPIIPINAENITI